MMRNEKKVILSFDYELFFGDVAGTVQKSLIDPTNKILDTLGGEPAVFFVDYLMLKRMNEENGNTRKEAEMIEAQLKDIVRRGSRIELHLHPHWVDAKYVKGTWDFSGFSHYCLKSFSRDEVTRMFVEGTKYLNDIAREVDPGYKVIAFRAGGWAVLPFDVMRDGFEQADIKVDSSVMKGVKVEGYGYSVDFTESPEPLIYNFEKDVLEEQTDGRYKEVQIASYMRGPLYTLINSLYYRFFRDRYRSLTDGTHNQKSKDVDVPVKKRSLKEKLYLKTSFAVDYACPIVLAHYLKKFEGEVCVTMGHPKDFRYFTCVNITKIKKIAELTDYNRL